MAYTIYPEAGEDYIFNKFSCRRWGKDRNLVTTDHGAWAVLTDHELMLLKTMKAGDDPSLFKILKDKGIVVTRSNINGVIDDYRKRFHFLDYGPTLHIVVPTFRCNQRCIYCHSRSKPPNAKGQDMNKKTAEKVVDFILKSPSNSLVIEFQGGDCSLNFDVMKHIIEYGKNVAETRKKRVRFSVVTNLTTMTEEMLGFLKDHKIMGLSTSLDGPKEVHDANRKYIDGTGTYDDVTYWIKRIKSEFKYDFNLNALTTVTRNSLQHPEEIVEEFASLGFNSVWFRFLDRLGYAESSWEKIGYTAEEYLDFWRRGLSYILELNRKKPFQEVFSRLFTLKILETRDPMYVDIQSPCGAAIGQLLYDHNGDIYTCDEAKILGDTFKLGNVFKSSFSDVIKHPTTASMLNVSSKLTGICDNCAYSPYCGICPVDTYKSQGSIVPKLAESFRCKVFAGMLDTIFNELVSSEKSRKTLTEWIKRPL